MSIQTVTWNLFIFSPNPFYEPPQTVKVGGRPSDYLEGEISFELYLTSQEYYFIICTFMRTYVFSGLFRLDKVSSWIPNERIQGWTEKKGSEVHEVLQNTKLRFFSTMRPIHSSLPYLFSLSKNYSVMKHLIWLCRNYLSYEAAAVFILSPGINWAWVSPKCCCTVNIICC